MIPWGFPILSHFHIFTLSHFHAFTFKKRELVKRIFKKKILWLTPWGFPIPWLPKNCQSQSRAHSGSPSCAPDDQMKYFNKVKKDKSPLYPPDDQIVQKKIETKFSSILFFNRKKSSIYLYPIAAKVVEDDFESNLVLIWCHRHFSANIQNKYFKLVLVCRDISLKSSKIMIMRTGMSPHIKEIMFWTLSLSAENPFRISHFQEQTRLPGGVAALAER